MSKGKGDECRERGNDCMNRGRPTEAFFYYTEAIKLNPYDYRAYSNRSLAFLKIEQHYHALEDAKKAIQLKPDWPKGHFRKGEVELRTGYYKEAVTSYETAVGLDENDPKLKEALANAKKEFQKMKAEEIRIPLIAVSIGLLIGLLIILGDHYLASQPSLEGFLKPIFLVMFGMLGYSTSWMYFFVRTTYREAMLQAPTSPDEATKKETQETLDPMSFLGRRPQTAQAKNNSKSTGEARHRKKTEKT